jgi:hypothetical protein
MTYMTRAALTVAGMLIWAMAIVGAIHHVHPYRADGVGVMVDMPAGNHAMVSYDPPHFTGVVIGNPDHAVVMGRVVNGFVFLTDAALDS